jgi:hypothetical protein
MRSPAVVALTLLVLLDALGWAIGVLFPLRYAMTHRSLPTVAGIRLLSGPFEALGLDSLIVCGLLFVVVSLLKLFAAYWIWNLQRDGLVLQLVLLSISAIFWYGFALPFGPPAALLQMILLILTWKQFT